MFASHDQQTLASYGIAVAEAERQVELLRRPRPYRTLVRPCTLGDGIHPWRPAEQEDAVAAAEMAIPQCRLVRFVPASGAATRMFDFLTRAVISKGLSEEEVAVLADKGDADAAAAQRFFTHLQEFAFWPELQSSLSATSGATGASWKEIVHALLDERQLGYSLLPKGLALFHRDAEGGRTAFDEHLTEATLVASGADVCAIHFTIQEEHRGYFTKRLEETTARLKQSGAPQLEVEFSTQPRSTMTLALTSDREPCRLADGSLLLRPGGHGSLIQNLAAIEADVAYLGNIDNVVPPQRMSEVVRWRKVLIGRLAELQNRARGWLASLTPHAESVELDRVAGELHATFGCDLGDDFAALPVSKRRLLLETELRRPMRVCGVVKNVGEPGGGPFWVRGTDGRVSLQIVEGAEVDRADDGQKSIFAAATHFNPVNMACALKDPEGRPLALSDFVDESAVMISNKSERGQALTVLEHPGLWNGAMSRWLTAFVEIPLSTFNPVKVVNDLLREAHQP